MRTRLLVSLLVIFLTSFKCETQSHRKSTDDPAVKMLKAFYTSYITMISDSMDSIGFKEDTIKFKYCTTALIEQIDDESELDYDPLISAQDADKECLKTLIITKDFKESNIYCFICGEL